MPDATRAIDIIFRGQDQVSDDINKISNALTTVNTDADFASRGVDDLGESFDLVTTSGALLGRTLGGLFAGFTVAEVAQDFIAVNSQIENFGARLSFAGQTSEQVGEQLNYVREIADRFGINLASAADIYGSFIARVGQSGLTIEELQTVFEGFSGSILAAGGSTQDIEGAFLQLTQGITRGRFELEDLKGVWERVPNSLQLMEQALGKTSAEIYEMISAGQIGREEILKFAEVLQDASEGAGFNTFDREVERLKTAYQELLIAVGESGAFDVAVSGVKGLTTVVENAGTISGWSFVADGIGLIRDAAEKLLGITRDDEWNLFTGLLGNAADEIARLQEESLQSIGIDLGLDGLEKIADEFDRIDRNKSIADSVAESFWNAADAAEGAAQQVANIAENTLEAKVAANNLAVSLEEIASNERISTFEIRAELTTAQLEADTERLQATLDSLDTRFEIQAQVDIAQIEADTQRIQAAFESVNTTIVDTGQSLSGLFSLFASDNISLSERFKIERQIDEENRRRDEALELQKQLTEAQIREIEARAASLENGEAAITINGDGLAPELEAFMYAVLERVQTRTNSEGLALLLGAGA